MYKFDIDGLRANVDLNFCESCKKKYRGFVEPFIKNLIENYFNAWKDVEKFTMIMVMKLEEVYKTQVFLIDDEDKDLEKYEDRIHVKKYKEVKKNYKAIKKRITYLHKNGILGDASYDLLEIIRTKRNRKIHGFKNFTLQDLREHEVVSEIVRSIWITMFDNSTEEFNKIMRDGAEQRAKRLLSEIKTLDKGKN